MDQEAKRAEIETESWAEYHMMVSNVDMFRAKQKIEEREAAAEDYFIPRTEADVQQMAALLRQHGVNVVPAD